MKIGRNDPCPCGSGKKYKYCCYKKVIPIFTKLESAPELEELRKRCELESMERKIRYLEPLGIYVDFVKPLIYDGGKWWSLNDKVYYNHPANETFHEFIIKVLCQTLGEQWRREQADLPEEQQHFIYHCWLKFNEWAQRNAVAENKIGNIYSNSPDGWTKSLLSLAFDVASIIHKEHMPIKLLNRLKNKAEYQGARYEVAIAAIFARLGFKLQFLDEQETVGSHPEFIANDVQSGESIAVEAKSKHREGVIHVPGKVQTQDELLRGDIQLLYRHALKQNPGNIPFLIFIDLNAPPSPNINWKSKKWFADIIHTMDKQSVYSDINPDPCTGIAYTNYSYHYQTDQEALGGEHVLSMAMYPRFTLQTQTLYKLETALSHYGEIPNLDVMVSS